MINLYACLEVDLRVYSPKVASFSISQFHNVITKIKMKDRSSGITDWLTGFSTYILSQKMSSMLVLPRCVALVTSQSKFHMGTDHSHFSHRRPL